MNKIKEFIYKTTEKLGFKGEDILPFLISVTLALVFFFDSTYFHDHLLLVSWVILGITISILVTWIAVNAGFVVLKNLFLLSAEISLLIFLAQSYCDKVKVLSKSDDALKVLITLGIAYISYEFFKALFEALRKKLDSISKEKWTWEKVFVVALFLVFTFVFIRIIYQVTSPIIYNLCVYNR